jgi:uncharacterized membrane-anchored protein
VAGGAPERGEESRRRERLALSNEWHARPGIVLPPPLRCTHLVTLREPDSEAGCRAAIGAFCERRGQSVPAAGSRYHLVDIGVGKLKWELHTEAVSHTVLVPGNAKPAFSESALDFLETALQQELTGGMFIGVQIEVLRVDDPEDPHGLHLAQSLLGASALYGALMSDGNAAVWSSFHPDARGFQRLLVVDLGINKRRLARLLQRLLDIESYRMLAMRSLPLAREVMGTLQQLEPELDTVLKRLAGAGDDATREQALRALTGIAARVEHIATSHVPRFAASRAYAGIVERRAEELKEQPIGNHQSYTSFLSRALTPGMRTCDATERRIGELAERVARSANLLSTMVDIQQARQSNTMLESMARNARAQLRLQQAVEGFSIFAISYYAVGMIKYSMDAAEHAGLPVDASLVAGLAAPLVFAGVFISVRSIRRRLTRRGEGEE